MSRWRQGWELTKKSWAVLKSNRELMRFPIYGALLAIALVIVLVVPGAYLIEEGQNVIGGLLVALGLYGASFVSVYFGVALAACADKIFRGEAATMADGLAVAKSHTGAIAGWAALSVLVGTVISAIQQTGSIGEAIVATLIGAAWGLITFLAIPVITFEGTGPWGTLKRSASLFKERWQGQITGNVAIGGIVFLVGMLPAIALIAGGAYLLGERHQRRDGRRRVPRDPRRAPDGRCRAHRPGAQGDLRRRALPLRVGQRADAGLHRAGHEFRRAHQALALAEQPRVVRDDPIDAELGQVGDPLVDRRPSRRTG